MPSIREITDAVQPSRQQRRDAMAGQPQMRAQQRGQQAQALQATRASHQATAAAARRAAALQNPTLPVSALAAIAEFLFLLLAAVLLLMTRSSQPLFIDSHFILT